MRAFGKCITIFFITILLLSYTLINSTRKIVLDEKGVIKQIEDTGIYETINNELKNAVKESLKDYDINIDELVDNIIKENIIENFVNDIINKLYNEEKIVINIKETTLEYVNNLTTYLEENDIEISEDTKNEINDIIIQAFDENINVDDYVIEYESAFHIAKEAVRIVNNFILLIILIIVVLSMILCKKKFNGTYISLIITSVLLFMFTSFINFAVRFGNYSEDAKDFIPVIKSITRNFTSMINRHVLVYVILAIILIVVDILLKNKKNSVTIKKEDLSQ